MALSTPAGTFILVGGINVTGDIYTANYGEENIIEESHTFGDSWEEQIPIGIAKFMLETGEGLYDDRAIGQIQAFRDPVVPPQSPNTAPQLVSLMLSGSDVGDLVTMINGTYVTKFNRGPKKDGLTVAKADHSMTGVPQNGIILEGLDGITGATGDTEAASVDIADFVPRIPIVSSTTAEIITTAGPHGLAVGDEVFIAAHGGGYSLTNTSHLASQIRVTVVDTGASIVAGTVRLEALDAGGNGVVEEMSIAAGAGVYTFVGTFTEVLRFNHYGVTVLAGGGDETILVEWVTGGQHIVVVQNLVEATVINNAANTSTAVITVPSLTTFTITGPVTVGGQGGYLKRVKLASGVADLHVIDLALGGYTDLVVTVRHSNDDAAWVSAGSFAAVTVEGVAERITIANLRRYRAISWAYGGAGAGPTAVPFVVVERG
jgi:hypothetical protein